MLQWLLSLALLYAAGDEKPALTCARSFDEVLDRHVTAIKQRDLPAYMSTIEPRDERLMILPDGSMWQSPAEIEAGHKQWFADPTWQFNNTLMRKVARLSLGLVVYEVRVDRPDKPGSPFLLSMLFAPESDGCWYLLHDQNTPLPAGED